MGTAFFLKRCLFYWLLPLSIVLIVRKPAGAQNSSITAKRLFTTELSLKAKEEYTNPVDTRVWFQFTGPEGQKIKQEAFWDGDSTYIVRFAAPTTGTWSYKTTCSNADDQGLNNREGTIKVEKATGLTTKFQKHGWLKVSKNGRYLVYDDNTPFFWLGDTAWEISWKSTREQLHTYLDDRASKDFSAIQFVPLSHQRLFKYGVENRYGEPFFLNEDFDKINPAYFDYIDHIVDEINKRGMVAVIVPLWASRNVLHFNPQYSDYALNREQSLRIARYIGARYAGNEVVWIIGGDNEYDTPEIKDFWTDFAHTIEQATGDRQLLTMHPSGWHASFNYFDNETDWLDFHMYQASHIARADYTWKAAQQGWDLKPAMPVLNAEGPYEDIYNRLWEPGDTSRAGTFRIRAQDVRQAAYESIMAGAQVGYTYGGNGIWQWNVEGLWASHQPRYTVLEAINLPGSGQMSVMKKIMQHYDWYKLHPALDGIISFVGRDRPMLTMGDQKGLMFMATGTETVNVAWSPRRMLTNWEFINPVTGNVHNKSTEKGRVDVEGEKIHVTPPDTSDWVLSFKYKTVYDSTKGVHLYQNFPNPFNNSTTIYYQLNARKYVDLAVYDIQGRKVASLINSMKEEGLHRLSFKSESLSSGVYVIYLKTPRTKTSKKMLLVK